MKKFIKEGDQIPTGYGIAYLELDRLGAIAYPIPLNLIVSGLRKLWLWAMYGHKLYEDGYTKGYETGESEGRKYAFNQYKSQALGQSIFEIIDDYHKSEDEAMKKFSVNPRSINGWIHKFIEEEKKKLAEKL